jgi:hypothetical protein
LQEEQSDEEQPEHPPDTDETSPLFPEVKHATADMMRSDEVPHIGQSAGLSYSLMGRNLSNFLLHLWQWYS